LEDFLRDVPHGAPWAGELLPQHADVLHTLRALVPEDSATVLPALLSGASYETRSLLPWYGRTP